MQLLTKFKQFWCWHAMAYPQHCNLKADGDYTYTCSGCNKTWTKEELKHIHRRRS